MIVGNFLINSQLLKKCYP